MDLPATCGEGLAAHGPLPAALGELAAATAEVLAAHYPMLDESDPVSVREREAYEPLVEAHRRVAADLQALAQAMANCRALPMGRHRDDAAANAAMARAFSRFLAAEEALCRLLSSRLADDREMAGAMSASE